MLFLFFWWLRIPSYLWNSWDIFPSRSVGVVEYLTTEISTSKQKRFSLVTFVDTPGLVDGDMKYPFDVDKAIVWLGKNVKCFREGYREKEREKRNALDFLSFFGRGMQNQI